MKLFKKRKNRFGELNQEADGDLGGKEQSACITLAYGFTAQDGEADG